MKIKVTKEIVSAIVSVVSAIICSCCAGCRLTLGNLEVEFDAISTNVVKSVVK